MKPFLKLKRGFTLLELLIVIVIIAVLAGIAVPVGRSMLAKSREASCLGNLRTIGTGLQLYLQDNNNRLPTLALGRSDKSSPEPVLETVILGYLDSEEAFHCPADNEEFEKTGCSYNWNITQNGLHMSAVSFFGIDGKPELIPLVSDKESWHPSGTNFLYADFSSSNKVYFTTRSEN